MSADGKQSDSAAAALTEAYVEQERSERVLKAKELYSRGSRNFLVKSYAEAADELSQVCALYEELHGELSDELGMPYLLYAKSLIALALDENKLIDVPDVEDDDDGDDVDDDDDDDGEENSETDAKAQSSSAAVGNSASSTSAALKKTEMGDKLNVIKEAVSVHKSDEADSTADGSTKTANENAPVSEQSSSKTSETQVSSTNDGGEEARNGVKNGTAEVVPVVDGEKPSTSNGDAINALDGEEEDDEENEAASNLQLAWEILELAAKIFSRQGMGGLPNLAEVQIELANIEFENNIPDAARDDYEKALKIYKELPTNYRRAMAEIYYKIGLTYLMQQFNKEAAESLKEACILIEAEIDEMNAKEDHTEKDKNNIQDMEETKQEIWAKIAEIEETQAQNIAEVRAALDSYIRPMAPESNMGAGTSSSSAVAGSGTSAASCSSSSSSATISSSKPTDISHLIKRKKPEEPDSEAEAATATPAKRPAV